MIKLSRLPPTALVFGALLLGLAMALPWAYVGGQHVGLDWVGAQAAIPAVLLGFTAMVAVASPRGRRWAVPAATVLGVLAGYGSLALARAIPTMAAVWNGAEGSRGPALVAILASEAVFILAAWSTLLPRSHDGAHRLWRDDPDP